MEEKKEELQVIVNKYFVRVNDYEKYKEILEGFPEQKPFIKILAVSHVGNTKENPHFHFVCEVPQKLQAFRKWLLSRFTLGSGNGHMSIKVWNGADRTIQYMFHEHGAELVCNKGYSIEFIDEQKQKAIEFDRKKGEYGDTLFDAVYPEICTAKFFDNYTLQNSHYELAFLIWDVCKNDKRNYPNKYVMESLIQKLQAIMSSLNGTESFSEVKSHWYEKMFRN